MVVCLKSQSELLEHNAYHMKITLISLLVIATAVSLWGGGEGEVCTDKPCS